MKMTKGQGISLAILIVVFSIFSVLMFTMPIPKRLVFWLGYLFAAYAVLVMIGALFGLLKRQTDGEQFLNMPVVVVAWLYLANRSFWPLLFKIMGHYLLPFVFFWFV